jgi:membrane associated rhomboid family serine protease
MQHTVKEELKGILSFVGVIWVVFLADVVIPVDINAWGVVPRTTSGLIGIPAMPFLHAGWQHLLGNTVPLTVLLCLTAGSRANSRTVVICVILAGGSLLWLFGRNANHIGASGLIYGLMAFLLVAGTLERRLVPLAVAVLVGFLYGGTLFFGVLPTAGEQVSWDGHLFGAIAGGLVAFGAVRRSKK